MQEQPSSSSSSTTMKQACIFVVDDSRDSLLLVSSVLIKQGYQVQTMSNGLLALAAAQAAPPDLLLLDIMIPDIDGYEVCKRLKANDRTRDIPVVFISGLHESFDKAKAFEVGGVDYITKPFQVQEVILRVAAHLALQNVRRGLQAQNVQFQQELAERREVELALRRRDEILQAMETAAEQILRTTNLSQNIQILLENLGKATQVSRVYVFENGNAINGGRVMSQRYEWVAPGITPQIDNPELQQLPYDAGGFGRWEREMSQGNLIYGNIQTFPDAEQAILQAQDIHSIAVVPIFVDQQWWGFIGYDDCTDNGNWSALEIDTLKTVANMIGAAIQRARVEEALRMVRSDLERRVEERTARLSSAITALKTEIAERLQAEQALNIAYNQLEYLNCQVVRSRDLLRTTFDVLDDGLALFNGAGVVQSINRALAALFNSAPQHLVGQSWESLCRRANPVFPGALVQQTLHDYRVRHRRERMTNHLGQVRILDMRTMPLVGVDQMIDQVVLHVIDVTERLELEELAIQHQKFVESSKLAASVAHEVNTPLHALQTFLYLAQRATDDQRDTYFQMIGGEIDRISTIVKQFLDLYRFDTNKVNDVHINKLFEHVLLLTGGTLLKYNVVVERYFTSDLPSLRGRTDQLTQVLLNLIINAIDAMPGGGILRLFTRVEVRESKVEEPGDVVISPAHPQPLSDNSQPVLVIEVEDTGIGISPDVQMRIFDSFFTTKAHGTGLGLAISRRIINQHRGTITVRSTVRQGSAFTIILPIHHEEMVVEE